MDSTDRPASDGWSPAKIAGMLLGAAVGRYSGLNLAIPLVSGLVALGIGTRVITSPAKHFVPAISVQAGHMMWFLAGLLVLGADGLSQVGIDLVIMAAGLLWLMVRPGVWPVGLLASWQVLSLFLNVADLSRATVNSNQHKALVVHVALRLFAIYFLIAGLKALRQPAAATHPAIRAN